MHRRKILYEFEHATSLQELAAKAEKRRADGWVPSTHPREAALQIAPHTLVIRYSQSFYRAEGKGATLTAPWVPASC
jgi:hypothetical protein